MKRMFLLIGMICAASAGFSQDFILGGMCGIGSTVAEEANVDKQDLKLTEVFVAIFTEESTLLQLRAGRIKTRIADPTQMDLNYVSFTVNYLFDNPLGQYGLFAGPAYYTGKISYPNPIQPNTEPIQQEGHKLGAMAGVEGFFPLNQTFQIYSQISWHYIPLQVRQFTFQLGLGLAIRF